jgi:hypothetical protein
MTHPQTVFKVSAFACLSERRVGVHAAVVVLACCTVGASRAHAQGKTGSIETVTLQYRVALDAVAPSRFVAVSDRGISVPLEVTWDLPNTDAHRKQKAQFDELIRSLEAKGINGVEFECRGEWLLRGASLRITIVPELTEAGKKRIERDGG